MGASLYSDEFLIVFGTAREAAFRRNEQVRSRHLAIALSSQANGGGRPGAAPRVRPSALGSTGVSDEALRVIDRSIEMAAAGQGRPATISWRPCWSRMKPRQVSATFWRTLTAQAGTISRERTDQAICPAPGRGCGQRQHCRGATMDANTTFLYCPAYVDRDGTERCPPPLLFRGRKVVAEGSRDLEPGDAVLLYTDRPLTHPDRPVAHHRCLPRHLAADARLRCPAHREEPLPAGHRRPGRPADRRVPGPPRERPGQQPPHPQQPARRVQQLFFCVHQTVPSHWGYRGISGGILDRHDELAWTVQQVHAGQLVLALNVAERNVAAMAREPSNALAA